jgi:hypothetical protein
MDESFSFYLVSPAVWKQGGGSDVDSSMAMIAQGQFVFDKKAFNKYLYRPLQKELFFDRFFDPNGVGQQGSVDEIAKTATYAAQTFYNWFKDNDVFLNGTITIQVPSQDVMDPRIGEKIEFDGLSDAYFYVEGVSHNWRYGGKLESTLSVTRGYGLGKPIVLRDKIFHRAKQIQGKQFDEPK